MTHKLTLKQTVVNLIARHMACYSKQECSYILIGLNAIINFDLIVDYTKPPIDIKEFQNYLSRINEKEQRRRDEGVYYTPTDITEYIVANTYLNYLNPNNSQVYSVEKCLKMISQVDNSKLSCAKVFDPTCGTAEFLLSALYYKLQIVQCETDNNILKIAATIYGNDIAEESILLSKLRMFFAIIHILHNKNKALSLANILNRNFTSFDYVLHNNINPKYDIIIGNPPYIEHRKLPVKPQTNYGNSYADVLQNSINSIKRNSAIGFVIPLSFVSTTRMKKIRHFSYEKLSKMFVLNFADRPNCLFDGVHQKLTILLGVKGNEPCRVFSSSYCHWYADERNELLDNLTVLPVIQEEQYIPKIGNKFEESIFNKLLKTKGTTLDKLSDITRKNAPVYLNMRGCFWMKAFTFNPGSKEYRSFCCPVHMQKYLVALLNSNLFFLYWTIISDCWHITNKEIDGFKIPVEGVGFSIFEEIVNKLEAKLEKTKKYIGSKQTEYEYKHKDCKIEIDAIDVALKNIYNLTDDEVAYLQGYKLKYRTSNG